LTDKTEAPTPRRLRRAREAGDAGASSHAAQSIAFVAAVALAPSFVGAVSERTAAMISTALSRAASPGGPLRCDAVDLAAPVVSLVLPLLLVVAASGSAAYLVQTGGVLTARRLAPRLERLDPIAGLRGLLSTARLWQVARALAAGAVVGWLAQRGLASRIADLAHLPRRPGLAPRVAGATAYAVAWNVALAGLAFGVVDLVVTRRAWMDRLKMTKAEVRREHRDAEGDPQVKAARARAYQEMAAQATLADVRRASVVVVNPTHLACALRYDAGEGDEAPVVVAAGEGEWAARIVQAAREAGVPIVRDVPLARALVELEVGGAIPEALYQAVAEILRELWEDAAP
jgi:type III secretion protein U